MSIVALLSEKTRRMGANSTRDEILLELTTVKMSHCQLWPNIGFCKLLCRCNFNTCHLHQNSEAVLLRKAACGMTCECWMRKYIWENVHENL